VTSRPTHEHGRRRRDAPLIIVKTTSEHSTGVRRNRKYATDDSPIDLKSGDDVLVQVTVLTNLPGTHTIRYRMKFVRFYLDAQEESKKIWGERWRYIIECSDLCILRRPFDITHVQVSSKDYGAAVRYVYVDLVDQDVLRKQGYLDCV